MSIDAFLRLGETVTLGAHTFSAEEIKAFARKYDPQPFHIDEEAAEASVFGALCASGWHTGAMWMRYNLQSLEREPPPAWSGEGPAPEFGPSPGLSAMKWPRPVYAGDTVTFTRKAVSHRPLASRPGWRLVKLEGGARNQDGAAVLTFDNAVLLKAAI